MPVSSLFLYAVEKVFRPTTVEISKQAAVCGLIVAPFSWNYSHNLLAFQCRISIEFSYRGVIGKQLPSTFLKEFLYFNPGLLRSLVCSCYQRSLIATLKAALKMFVTKKTRVRELFWMLYRVCWRVLLDKLTSAMPNYTILNNSSPSAVWSTQLQP